jgi:F-type H+-transporting ATPase subunit epsilon
MAELNCQFVRPDRSLLEGPVANLVLVTYAGELGVWPGHAPEIVALGDGVVRIRRRPEDGGAEYDVVVSGGYAEIDDDGVIILADHARRADDIDPDVVRETRDHAIEQMEGIPEGDHRHAYYANKVSWCNLLLKQVMGDAAASSR